MMDTDTTLNNELPKNRTLRILKLLWNKFVNQPIYTKWITLILLLFTVLVVSLFFSTFFLWKILTYVFSNIFLRLLEWYLMLDVKLISKN